MDLGLEQKRALVTGASKGIGLAITRGLVAEGAQVVAAARGTSDELRTLVADGRVRHFPVDLATTEGPARLVASALEDGPIDVLVNNVGGVTPRLEGFLAVSDDEWASTLALTFLAAVRMTRATLPGMIATARGTIVTICSVNAFLPDPLVIDYCAAKAALANFSKAVSAEVARHGIRVNTVSPGPVATGLWLGDEGVAAAVAHATEGDPGAVARRAASDSATGRFSEPEEVADLVLVLASDRAGNVTGADFVIDGGLVKTL